MNSYATGIPSVNSFASLKKSGAFTFNIFSKNLHWLKYHEMAAVAAELGFEGIDLTVRPEGHVLPERATEDLPKAVEAIKQAGLNVYMITTAITGIESQFAESILKTASSLGVAYYRMGWIQYDSNISMEDNLSSIRKSLRSLADLNERYNIEGHYQNHSGTSFGSSIWDLWLVLKELNTPWIRSQYDVLHAIVEGANSWTLGLNLLKPYIGTLDIKDFKWALKDGKWIAEVVPLGEGMINYTKYLKLIKEYKLECPFSMHYEYALGGAENGAKVISVKKDEVLSAMKKDLDLFKKLTSEAGLR